jgi:hypothetical protein
MSVAFTRTIGISLTPVCPAQADDPTHRAAIGIDAGQNQTAGHADRPQTRLPVVVPVVDLISRSAIEQFNGQLERQISGDPVTLAFGPVSLEIHHALYVKDG